MSQPEPLEKIEAGILGLDHISQGGLIHNRTTLLVGSSGSGKTILSSQILHQRMSEFGESGIFVTFEERPSDIIRNVSRLGWNFQDLVDDGQLVMIDGSFDPDLTQETGQYDLSGVVAQIRHAVKENNANFVVLDSMGSLFLQYSDLAMIRNEIVRIKTLLADLGVTSIITAERTSEYGPISRHGIEEFVSDTVIVLRHVLEKEKVRRTIQVYKMRGAEHKNGEFPFVIGHNGLTILPISAIGLQASSTDTRIEFGNKVFDKMSGGGMFQDSVILVSGPTGSGKTLMCTTFASESCRNRQKTLYFGFEESQSQLERNARSWGMDFNQWEEEGYLKIVSRYPDSQGVAAHLLTIRDEIDSFQPSRIVIDSVSALERVSTLRGFREFVIGLTSLVKEKQICTVFTSTTPQLSGGDSVTDAHISTITDAIVLLRYIETEGELRRGILIIKMRGSQHDKEFREFTVDDSGLHIGNPIKNAGSLLFQGASTRS